MCNLDFTDLDVQPRGGYGPTNTRTTAYQPDARHKSRFSLLLMARIAQQPLYHEILPREATTAMHFINFINLALVSGYLHAGAL